VWFLTIVFVDNNFIARVGNEVVGIISGLIFFLVWEKYKIKKGALQ